jgi:hypothetical protein
LFRKVERGAVIHARPAAASAHRGSPPPATGVSRLTPHSPLDDDVSPRVCLHGQVGHDRIGNNPGTEHPPSRPFRRVFACTSAVTADATRAAARTRRHPRGRTRRSTHSRQ